MIAPRVTNLAAIIRRYRVMSGLSTRKLSHQIGISHSTLSRFENGIGELDGESLWRLIDWLRADSSLSDKNAVTALLEPSTGTQGEGL